MDDLTIPHDDGCNAVRLAAPAEPELDGDVSIKQDDDVIVTSRPQAIALHAWLGEYIEATEPKMPTTPESVIRAKVPNGNVMSLTLIGDTGGRAWRASTAADYDSSELRDWTLIFDAGRPL